MEEIREFGDVADVAAWRILELQGDVEVVCMAEQSRELSADNGEVRWAKAIVTQMAEDPHIQRVEDHCDFHDILWLAQFANPPMRSQHSYHLRKFKTLGDADTSFESAHVVGEVETETTNRAELADRSAIVISTQRLTAIFDE